MRYILGEIMKYLLLLFFVPTCLWGGIYYPWGLEGITGGLVFENDQVIDSISEKISGEFYSNRGVIYCKFEIEYLFSFNKYCDKFQSAHFYSVRADSISISSDDITNSTELDSSLERSIDSRMEKLATRYKTSYGRIYENNDSLTISPIQINIPSNNSVIIRVNGVLEADNNDIYLVNTSILARHPFFLNENSGISMASFSYILTPIDLEDKLTKVEYTFTTPNNLNIASSFFPTTLTGELPTSRERFLNEAMHGWYYSFADSSNDSIQIYWEYEPPSIIELDSTISYEGSFSKKSPNAIHFVAKSTGVEWFPGGAKLGFGSSPSTENFNMRFGWESALEINQLNILLGTDYETDFKGDNRIALTTLAALPQTWLLPSIAGGFGLPIDLNHKDIGIRVQYEASILLLGIVGTHDYFPARKEWRFSLYGQITF